MMALDGAYAVMIWDGRDILNDQELSIVKHIIETFAT
jgi:hypothetical protein